MNKKKLGIIETAKIKYISIDAVIPYAKNPRRKKDTAIPKVMKSIQEFGFKQPIVVDKKMVVIAGHTRLSAAIELGMEKIPVIIATDLTKKQADAYRIADNRTAEESTWDLDLLSSLLADLGDYDFSILGFDDSELSDLLNMDKSGLTDPDDVPDIPKKAKTKKGDIYTLGNHRLMCGDSTKEDDVNNLLNGTKPLLMVTDPPYGVNYDPAWRKDAADKGLIRYSPSALETVTNDDQINWSDAWALFPGNVAYAWYASLMHAEVADSFEQNGFKIRSQIIWAKSHFAISRGNYNWQHETCIYVVRGKANWVGDKSQSTLWQIAHVKNETGLATQKPVECMLRPILNNSKSGEIVYDPFLGSGTTMIAAEMEKRICYGMEIDQRYCDVIVKRWEEYTGQKAHLQ